MNWQDDYLDDLADRAARGESGAMTEWCRVMEVQLAPIVRRALRHSTHPNLPGASDLTDRILATARRLGQEDPVLAASGREGMVKPVARALAEAMLKRTRPEAWSSGRAARGLMETVRV